MWRNFFLKTFTFLLLQQGMSQPDDLPVAVSVNQVVDNHEILQVKPFERKKSDTSDDRGRGSSGAASVGGNTAVLRVTVPDNVRPGEEFQVYTGTRIVRVRCPPDVRPGELLQITVPRDPNPPTNPDSPNVSRIPDSDPPAFMVTIPQGVISDQQFPVTINGQQLMVTCPVDARPGSQVRIVPSPLPSDVNTQLFEVEVPEGVKPGTPFAVLAGGVHVIVTCPPNAGPGQRIRFKMPLALIQKPTIPNQAQIKLKYDKDGWTRTVRATDLKFQWIRKDDQGDIDLNKRFNFGKSAYVRKLEFRQGEDPRIRTGILSLVPASEAVVDSSKVKSTDGRDLVTYSDLAQAQLMNFDEKAQWFQDTCAQLCVEWNEGHMRMNVRRQFLLEDSVDAVMSLSRKDLRKLWRFEFIGEDGIDAGGLTREWFELVCKEIFDPDMGLWMTSTTNQKSMTINPASEWCCQDHLVYYRFLGRVIGKAMFDRHHVNGHFAEHIYKHILGWPIELKDLESVDRDSYRHLKELQVMIERGEDLSSLDLHFTLKDMTGAEDEIELVRGGKEIVLTNDNFPEYVESCLKYKLMGSVHDQMNELLLGFFDVIPEPLLTIFDYQEFEQLMCGSLPEVNVGDKKYFREHENVG